LISNVSFCNLLKDVAVATNFSGKVSENGGISSVIKLTFQNGLQYRDFNFKGLNGNNFSAPYRNLAKFGPVTSEIMMLEMITSASIRQKSAYHAKYVRIYWNNLYQICRFGRHSGGND